MTTQLLPGFIWFPDAASTETKKLNGGSRLQDQKFSLKGLYL